MIPQILAHLTDALDTVKLARTVRILQRQLDHLRLQAQLEEDRADTLAMQLELATQALHQAQEQRDAALLRADRAQADLEGLLEAAPDAPLVLTEAGGEALYQRDRADALQGSLARAEGELAVVRAESATLRLDLAHAQARALNAERDQAATLLLAKEGQATFERYETALHRILSGGQPWDPECIAREALFPTAEKADTLESAAQ